MGAGCLLSLVLGLAPRLALALLWIVRPERVKFAFDGFLVPLLGFLFLPILTFVHVLIAPGGVQGFDWLWLALALLADVGIWAAGGALNRHRLSSQVQEVAALVVPWRDAGVQGQDSRPSSAVRHPSSVVGRQSSLVAYTRDLFWKPEACTPCPSGSL